LRKADLKGFSGKDTILISKIFIDKKDKKFWTKIFKFAIFLIYHKIFILSIFFQKPPNLCLSHKKPQAL